MTASLAGIAVPAMALGPLLLAIFYVRLGWFPGPADPPSSPGALVLPAFTLATHLAAMLARMTRSSLLDAGSEDYIRTARAKGQTEGRVLIRHALANAAVPIVTVIGLGVAALIGGVVVTESVYTIPGLGRLTVDAVLARDYPTIQAVILLFSLAYVLINLIVDITYTFFDPRIRY
jgi:peptide/nickel transport system permease protein